MSEPPSGTVTFLFTDIEGSTSLWERYPEAMRLSLAHHNALLQQAVQAQGGVVFKVVGDAFQVAFAQPEQALAAALASQQALHAHPLAAWGETGRLRVRMGVHLGPAEWTGTDYAVSHTLNRVARVASAGHGDQVLLTADVVTLLQGRLPPDIALTDLGYHRLKGLRALERLYQAHAPDLPRHFPALRTLNARPNNLPAQPTPLIGREKETAQVASLLRQPDIRLVTQTGPGGTGKTRLALQVAADLLDEFNDGVYFVNLTPLTDSRLVASTIAQTLDIREQGGRPILETLKDAVRDKHALLVLDNFEQLTAAAPVVAELLAAAPRLKALVTSRAVLRLRGEYEFPVPPLGVPPLPVQGLTGNRGDRRPVVTGFPLSPPTADRRSAAYDPHPNDSTSHIIQYPAVALFVERAAAVKPDFVVAEDMAPIVAEICRRLDGLPLAIELAATRVRLLTPQAILTRLENRMKLLTGGPRDLPTRHQTLRNAIEWSHDLLTPAEQRLFRRLAVFVGGRTLEAVEAVCNAEGDLDLDPLDGMDALVSQSLVKQVVGDGGEPRFVMLETIHEYAAERLEASGEAEKVHERHLALFLRLAEEAEWHSFRDSRGVWLSRLELEHDNVRAALDWALRARPAQAVRLAAALGPFWLAQGHHTEGQRWLTHVLTQDQGPGPGWVAARARALAAQALIAHAQSDHAGAEAAAERSVALYRQVGDRLGLAHALAVSGYTVAAGSELSRGRTLLEESIELYRRQGDTHGLARALGWHAHAAYLQRDYVLARASGEESLALARETGLSASLAFTAVTLGRVAAAQGDYTSARAFYEQSLAFYRATEDKYNTQVVLAPLGTVAAKQGDFAQARAFLRESLALRLARGSRRNIAGGLDAFAYLAAAQGQAERAARLLGAADSLYDTAGGPRVNVLLVEYNRHLPAIRDHLGPVAFAAACATGRTLTLEQAVAYALEDEPPSV